MPARKLPPTQELINKRREGYTQQQIADWASEKMGTKISRSTVAAALGRAGEEPVRVRHHTVIPWSVKVDHAGEQPLRMLQAYARRERGVELLANTEKSLDNLLKWLDEEDAVIAYCRRLTPGFYYVRADEVDDRPDGIPIRPRELYPEEVIL